jgi:hypothetical protein
MPPIPAGDPLTAANPRILDFHHLRTLIGVADIMVGLFLIATGLGNDVPTPALLLLTTPLLAGLLILWRHAWGYWLGAILGVVGQVVGTVGLLLGFLGWGEQQGDWGPLLVLGGLLFAVGGLQWRSLQQSRAAFH